MELAGQLVIVAVVAAAAVAPLARWGGQLRIEVVLLAVVLVVTGGWYLWEPVRQAILVAAELGEGGSVQRRKVFKDRLLPRQQIGPEYVSSQTCRSCHPGRYASWHRTYHRTMTQLAGPDTVIPSHSNQYDGVVLQSRGRRYELYRRDEQFWVKMVDPDWDRDRRARGLGDQDDGGQSPPVVERQILMTTGSHHQQTYWVASRWGTELLQFPWEFHIGEKLWFPTEDAELREYSPERYSGHWNTSCIHCHSVAPNPGFLEAGAGRLEPGSSDRGFVMPGMGRASTVKRRLETAALYSEVAELGISCEACHGPAARHVAFHRNPARRLGRRLAGGPDPTIVNPKRLDHVRSSQVCGRCHALKVAHDKQAYLRQRDPYRPGGDLEEDYRLIKFDDPYHEEMSRQGSHLYWNDGSCRLGGREFLGQVASGCYTRGKMSCLSCHAMHGDDPNDQLIQGMDSDRACVQCHKTYTGQAAVAHTHHAAGSSGSRCYNCHMPHTSYALFTAIRVHRIKSPEVTPITHASQPNACNLCHLDKSLGWANGWLAKWYERDPVKLDEQEQTVAAGLLWMLRGDAAQRAIAGWHVRWPPAQKASGTSWQTPLLAQLLGDSYSAVRFIAWQSLKALPGNGELEYNFVDSPDRRQRVADGVLQAWQTRARQVPEVLPRTPDGRLDLDWLRRLWAGRDQRPVEIPE